MLTDEVLKALLEGIIYIAPEPVTLDGMLKALEGEERERVKAKLAELVADYEQNTHGIQIRQVANGYKFSTKAEHHETLRKYVKSLKPPIRLSKPALETLAVIAYRQPVTMPEIEEIRGVDSGGVIHTLLEKKLVVTSGRKSVVGRPILYRTSKDFLVHFGLKDVGELPSLKEFEELAKRALGAEWAAEAPAAPADGGAATTSDAAVSAAELLPEAVAQATSPTAAEPAAGETIAPAQSAPVAESSAAETMPTTAPIVAEPVAATTEPPSPPTADGEAAIESSKSAEPAPDASPQTLPADADSLAPGSPPPAEENPELKG